VSHTDPEFLALTALGEQAGTAQDAAHLAECADCQLEVERLTRIVELARRDGPASLEQPPASVWERIAASVGAEEAGLPDAGPADSLLPDAARAAANGNGRVGPRGRDVSARGPAGGGAGASPGRAGGRRRGLRVAVACLAAGLVIGTGGTVAVNQLTSSPASQVVAQIELRPLAQFPQWHSAAGTAALRKTQAVLQLAVSVTAPPRTGFYEVWLLGENGTSMISLGELDADHAGTFTLPAGVDLRFYSRIDVSLQPFNGSTQHSSTSVVRGSLPAAARGTAGSG
jgi:Anti-sigma-K factor rskA